MSEELEKLEKKLKNDGTRNAFLKSPAVLARAARVANRLNAFKGREGIYEEIILGNRLLKTEKKFNRTLFVIPGGGMIFSATKHHIDTGIELAKLSERDLFLPIYPTMPEHKLSEIYEMIFNSYDRVVKEYGAKNTAVLGLSSGGAAAFVISAMLNEKGRGFDIAEKIISVSPGIAPMTSEEESAMKDLSERDIQIPYEIFRVLEAYSEGCRELFKNPLSGDLSGIKNLTVYFGGEEIFSKKAPAIERACEKYSVPVEIIIGEGLFHCYPIFREFSEGEAAFLEMASKLR